MKKNATCRFIFVSGGVVSSVGKGVAAASIGKLLKENGQKIGILKFDPYLNVDAGTMSPHEHGEVFVTEDGAETDLDLGHYERFLNEHLDQRYSVTSGKIYKKLIDQERQGSFNGRTVQIIPHVTEEIKRRIWLAAHGKDVLIVEIGGTVGDIEALSFLTAVQQFSSALEPHRHLHVHLTWLPEITPSTLLKTKPTQHSIRELRSLGIMPDLLLCRANRALSTSDKEKLHMSCGISPSQILSMPTIDWIYRLPIILYEMGLLTALCQHFKLPQNEKILTSWNQWIALHDHSLSQCIKIVMVTKYSSTTDAYKSCQEALQNSGISLHANVVVDYLDAEWLESAHSEAWERLKQADGILVPGGFGQRGILGKVKAIQFARENKIPFFGICLGMQLTLIEFCQNVLGITAANSTEFDPNTSFPIISLVTQWKNKNGDHQIRSYDDKLGGTLRLGAQICRLLPETKILEAYQTHEISERHRHRYEINLPLFETLPSKGLKISARSQDNQLAEAVELEDHPWFVACQYHPEFKAKTVEGHPLFLAFLKAALSYQRTDKAL